MQMYGTGTVPVTVRRKLKMEIPKIRPAEVYVYDLPYVLAHHFATVKRFLFFLFTEDLYRNEYDNIKHHPSINVFFPKTVKSALLNSFVV